MPLLASSDAVFDGERLFSQHQAALTLLQRLLADPAVQSLKWLDLACGKGQILAQLDENLNIAERAKIDYLGYDLDVEFGRLTEKRASTLGFAHSAVEVGELSRFSEIIDPVRTFNFITLTNTIHEIAPTRLPGIIFDCILKLSDEGSLFIYDMERLPSAELGAVPWKPPEIQSILQALLRPTGVTKFVPPVGRWRHRLVAGWNTQIEKRHILKESNQFSEHREAALAAAGERINEVIHQRREACANALESLARFGSSTGNENAEEIAFLYEYWALNRVLGGH